MTHELPFPSAASGLAQRVLAACLALSTSATPVLGNEESAFGPAGLPVALKGGFGTESAGHEGLGPGLFFAWQNPYGLPGVHSLLAGAHQAWEQGRFHLQFAQEDWDGYWRHQALNLGVQWHSTWLPLSWLRLGALRLGRLRIGGEWIPQLQSLALGEGDRGNRLVTGSWKAFDLGADWKWSDGAGMALTLGAAYAPGPDVWSGNDPGLLRIWVQGEWDASLSQSLSQKVGQAGWRARLVFQGSPGEKESAWSGASSLAGQLAYAWSHGFALQMTAQVPWSLKPMGQTLKWGTALTLPWGRWRGHSGMISQSGLPATLGAAIGWGNEVEEVF